MPMKIVISSLDCHHIASLFPLPGCRRNPTEQCLKIPGDLTTNSMRSASSHLSNRIPEKLRFTKSGEAKPREGSFASLPVADLYVQVRLLIEVDCLRY